MPPSRSDVALAALEAFGLAYPGAHTKAPWPGHNDLAVKDKTFAYLSVPGEPFSIGCKLPNSSHVALMLPFAVPTPYGLGKSGWVTATPPADQPVPVELFKEWIDESYRAQAPKTLVKQIGQAPTTAPAKPATKKTVKAARPAAKKATKKSTQKPTKKASRARR